MDRTSRPAVALETTPIYVAKHNLNLGDPIDASMLSLQEWPKDKVPRGAISNLEDLEGRRPRTAIIEGEPILDAKLLAPGQIADPIRSIAPGMRLKTISVDAEKSAAGLLGPGDRVDVELFVKADAKNNIMQAQTKVILQNIRVFAVDSTVQRSPDGGEEKTIAKTVSLMLTPDQATKLTLAENMGVISLIPRNPDDETVAEGGTYRAEDLWDETGRGSRSKEQGRKEDVANDEPKEPDHGGLASVVAAAAPPPEPPYQMEVIEREAVRLVLFDRATGKPIRDAATNGPTAGPGIAPSGTGVTNGPTPAEPTKSLDDFPIDFDSNG
jgi:pilus assembly protein CpaB